MAEILEDTTKIKILASVDEFDKTAVEEQRIQELLEYYKNHQIPKKIFKKKYAQSDHKDHVFMGSPKCTNLILHADLFSQWSTLPNTASPKG